MLYEKCLNLFVLTITSYRARYIYITALQKTQIQNT